MILRPRQKLFVRRTLRALNEYKNTLGIAPTGAGKTIIISKVIGEWLEKYNCKVCVLAHRDELTTQNRDKFHKVNPKIKTSIFNANEKSWDGDVTFAMVQTLTRDNNLKEMPEIGLLVIDESHHIVAPSYRRIIEHAKENNKNLVILGVTATPNRGDKKGLKLFFNNVADQITINELIKSGHLVPPRTFIIDTGTNKELLNAKKSINDFNMVEVESIMNKIAINDSVVNHWKEKADGRKTVIFCSTVNHAKSVSGSFNKQNIESVIIHGKLSSEERENRINKFTDGNTKIIINVSVLTEGWDYPPLNCVVLLRPSSLKSTMVQMIGRGLRTINPEEYPGIIKKDCIVLDFGISTILHGSLEEDVNLDGRSINNKEKANTKECPQCKSVVPISITNCPICDYYWKPKEKSKSTNLSEFEMVEIDILNKSPFLWCDLFGDNKSLFITGFDAWTGIFSLNDLWYSIGWKKQCHVRLLSVGEKNNCIAASNDWMNDNETDRSVTKIKTWLKQNATSQQLRYLPIQYKNNYNLSKYYASCLLSFFFNKKKIKSLIFNDTQV